VVIERRIGLPSGHGSLWIATQGRSKVRVVPLESIAVIGTFQTPYVGVVKLLIARRRGAVSLACCSNKGNADNINFSAAVEISMRFETVTQAYWNMETASCSYFGITSWRRRIYSNCSSFPSTD
jgi:hypothetical protein